MNESKFLGVSLYTICDSFRVYEIYAPEIPQEYCYNFVWHKWEMILHISKGNWRGFINMRQMLDASTGAKNTYHK